jgi:hypothetical protein
VESADTRSVASEARSRKSVDFEDRSRVRSVQFIYAAISINFFQPFSFHLSLLPHTEATLVDLQHFGKFLGVAAQYPVGEARIITMQVPTRLSKEKGSGDKHYVVEVLKALCSVQVVVLW